MTVDNTCHPAPRIPLWKHIEKAFLVILLIPVLLALYDFPQLLPTLIFAAQALLHTGTFIVFAVLAVGYLKATGAETILAKAFANSAVFKNPLRRNAPASNCGDCCSTDTFAVWARVKSRVFFAYPSISMFGAVLAGMHWSIAA